MKSAASAAFYIFCDCQCSQVVRIVKGILCNVMGRDWYFIRPFLFRWVKEKGFFISIKNDPGFL